MFVIKKYRVDDKIRWDEFVKNAKNSHFFFHRDYMEYHADRFQDFSLMIYNEKNKLVALLPANKKDGVLYSHQGLTFGGLLIDSSMRTEMVLNVFDSLKVFLKEQGIQNVIYKCIPYIYHTMPAEEDSYALFRHQATLMRRDVSATINLHEAVRYSKGRKWTVNKAKKESIVLVESDDMPVFWVLLEETILQQHASKPTHTVDEMILLKGKFPKNIRLFIAMKEEKILAGALMYENKGTVHTQYLANSEEGRNIGALDLLLDHLIKNVYSNKHYFDFGISNEENGQVLNTGLMAQKEGFGARAVAHDFYEWNL